MIFIRTANQHVLVCAHRRRLDDALHSVQGNVVLLSARLCRILTGKQFRARGGKSEILTGFSDRLGGIG